MRTTFRFLMCFILAFVSCAAVDIEDAAKQVYERIARVAGISGQPPRLIVQTEAQRQANRLRQQIAWFDHAANTIGIDRRTLDLCAG